MDIEVCSIKMLKYKLKEGMDTNNTYCIINTSYPESIEFLDNYNLEDVIILQYDDIKDFNSNSFSENLAQDIKYFVDRLPNNCKLFICCDEGVSRSSAIACAIKRYIGQDEMTIWNDPHYHPNIFVYNILCNIFGFFDTEDRLKELQGISDNSLSNTINNSRK